MKNHNSRTNRYINPIYDTPPKRTVFLLLDSLLPFGKYKNNKLIDVINKDFSYILWAKREKIFMFTEESNLYIKEKKEKNIEENPKFKKDYTEINEQRKKENIKMNKPKTERILKKVYIFDEKKKLIDVVNSRKDVVEKYKIDLTYLDCKRRKKEIWKDKYYFSYYEFETFI